MTLLEHIRTTPLGELARLFNLHPSLQHPERPSEKSAQFSQSSSIHLGSAPGTTDDQIAREDVVVDWYGPDDPENPKNYSTITKTMLTVNVCILTVMTYMGSSVYTMGLSGQDSVQSVFQVDQTITVLGLSLFVIGYGTGPVLFHALIENQRIGRLPVYFATTLVFFAIQIATVYSPNMRVLLALRFLAGVIGSPSLATGGASLGDVYDSVSHTRSITFWALGAVLGISAIVAGFAIVNLTCTMPETLGTAILYRRMRRLQRADRSRKYVLATGEGATVLHLLREAAWDPIQLFMEPTLLVYNSYLSLIYGLFYLWFESFPVIFVQIRGFSPHQLGLSFLGVLIGSLGAVCVFRSIADIQGFVELYLVPLFKANDGELPHPRVRLYPAAFGAFMIPISMLGVGWSGQYASVHWIVPIIFSSLFPLGAMTIFPSTLGYLGDVYRTRQNAVYTLNDLCRSSLAGSFPLFAHAMFNRLGIAWANTLLAGIAILFIPAPLSFIHFDTRIRAASKYQSAALEK